MVVNIECEFKFLTANISRTVFSLVNVTTFVCRSSRPTMFKVWSHDRQQKKLVSASSVQELLQKGIKSRAVARKPLQDGGPGAFLAAAVWGGQWGGHIFIGRGGQEFRMT